MNIDVNEKSLFLRDLVQFMKETNLDDNAKVVYDDEDGSYDLIYCQHGDLITFIPDYDEAVKPLTIGGLKTIIEKNNLDKHIAINFANRSEIYGIDVIVKNDVNGDLMFMVYERE